MPQSSTNSNSRLRLPKQLLDRIHIAALQRKMSPVQLIEYLITNFESFNLASTQSTHNVSEGSNLGMLVEQSRTRAGFSRLCLKSLVQIERQLENLQEWKQEIVEAQEQCLQSEDEDEAVSAKVLGIKAIAALAGRNLNEHEVMELGVFLINWLNQQDK